MFTGLAEWHCLFEQLIEIGALIDQLISIVSSNHPSSLMKVRDLLCDVCMNEYARCNFQMVMEVQVI